MATLSLSLCTSLTTTRPSNKQTLITLSSSSPNPKTLKLTSHSHSLSSSHRFVSSRTSLFVPKLSETVEAPVLEAEEEALPEPSIEEAKREEIFAVVMGYEEIFAVVMIGGRQYIVFPGRFITTTRFKDAKVNDKVILNKVLLVGTKTSTYVGKPIVENAAVHAVVEEQGLNKKVVVFKYKKKKNYRRNIGHRQPNTRIKILGITGYENSPVTTLE